MKLIGILTTLLFFTVNAHAGNTILGKWNDKGDPSSHKYEFKEDHDFIYTYQWEYEGKLRSKKSIGVWETGAWELTKSNGSKSTCNLKIYADNNECCFESKFIADNLVLTNKYTTDVYDSSMCKNRVLVKEE